MSQCWDNRMDCERFDFEKFAEMIERHWDGVAASSVFGNAA